MRRNIVSIGLLMFALGLWCSAQIQKETLRITNGPVVEKTDVDSAVVAWSTNTGGGTVVKYGTDPNNLSKTEAEPYARAGNTHRVELKNLQPNTTYYFKVVSAHGQGTGTEVESPVQQFTTTSQGSSGDKVPMYRARIGASHLFTTSHPEMMQAIQGGSGADEGIAAYIMRNQGSGLVPLYHLHSPYGDEFYTSSDAERQAALSHGLQDKGIAGYVASSQLPGTVPLYRVVYPQNGQHFYTTRAEEKASTIQKGARDEGVAGYVWPQ